MKKTLITLAALAASVASAATLNLTSSTLPESITFAGDGSDIITINSAISVVGIDGTGGSAIGGVKILNAAGNAADLFYHTGGSRNAAFVGGTIDFGSTGSLSIAQPDGTNFGTMGLTFSGTLNTVIYTEDASLVGTSVVQTRSLIDVTMGQFWNREGKNEGSFTLDFKSSENASLTQLSYGSTLTASDLGKIVVINNGDSNVSVQYVATYAAAPVTPDTPAVPEPTTATLSLLALAGLAARRRRK